jgi:hypothetical protein
MPMIFAIHFSFPSRSAYDSPSAWGGQEKKSAHAPRDYFLLESTLRQLPVGAI